MNMKQKDPIIQNILDKRYEQEKQLYALEQQLMSLGYKLRDIQGNFMLDYIDSGKYTPEMESLVSKINTGLFCNTTVRDVQEWQKEKKKISFFQREQKRYKKGEILYVGIDSINILLGINILITTILFSLPLALPLAIVSAVYTVYFTINDISHFRKILSLNSKISELNTNESELNEKIKKRTKVKENETFKTYSMVLQAYLEDLYKHQNIHEDIDIEYHQALENHYYMKPGTLADNFEKFKKTEQKKEVLKKYHDILEEMKPINEISKKRK